MTAEPIEEANCQKKKKIFISQMCFKNIMAADFRMKIVMDVEDHSLPDYNQA